MIIFSSGMLVLQRIVYKYIFSYGYYSSPFTYYVCVMYVYQKLATFCRWGVSKTAVKNLCQNQQKNQMKMAPKQPKQQMPFFVCQSALIFFSMHVVSCKHVNCMGSITIGKFLMMLLLFR